MNLRDDEGVATVLACCVLAAIVMVTGGMLHVGSAVVARHTAQSAADLSALGGAGALDGGEASACAKSAERMRTVLAECEVQGWDVVVEIRAPVLLSGFGIGDAQAYARAGPIG
ncbi:flp pilus-assembly TadE/G-like family protein [Rhodococcus erythropolis]|uniref:Rv3654c family TadE-like protein n=1 Tax=Rhodococcus erythropolis TaxID=1833 RepID=UPI001245C48E|nr:Rv3654c family TadE-like protein [Rhodococcus erythropolis]QEX09139.1 flp pilus-assembly TadE/G-like family protein [Rhodococcus erythropolis]